MAFTTTAVFECLSGGSDTTNGGIFDRGVAGFPTDGASTLANTGSPVFTSASYSFVAGDVGAFIYIKSGTNWIAGFYPIASVSAGAATLSAAIGAAVLDSLSGLNTAAGCASVASPTGATWGIDYTRTATPYLSFTDMVINVTTNTNFSSAGHPVGKNFVGNSISVTSGVGFTVQRVVVVSTSGTTATCDKSLGTLGVTGGNGGLGGGFGSPGLMVSLYAGSTRQTGFIRNNGVYSLTTATAGANGPLLSGNSTGQNATIGYGANRYFGNLDSQPVIQTNVSTCTALQGTGLYVNLTFDGNSQTASKLQTGTTHSIYCTFKNFNTVGGGSALMTACVATANSVAIFNGSSAALITYCEAFANTATPFTGNIINKCLSYGNTGSTTDGYAPSSGNQAQVLYDSISYGNGRDGVRAANNQVTCMNVYCEGNSGWGFNNPNRGLTMIQCSAFNNTLGGANTPDFNLNFQSLTATPFTNAGAADFSINNLAGAGSLLRQAGYLGLQRNLFPRGLTATYGDIGAAQHQDLPPIINQIINRYIGAD